MSMGFSSAGAVVVALVFATSAPAQWTVHFPDATSTGTGNSHPFAIATMTQFIQYPGTPFSPIGGTITSLQSQGVGASARLTQLATMPQSFSSGTYAANNAIIHVGHVVGTASATGWSSNLVNPVLLWDSTVDGPLTFAWTGAQWSPFVSDANGTFQWDGVNDIGISISVQQAGAVSNNFTVTTPTPGIYLRHGCSATFNPAAGVPQTTTGVLGMKIRMVFNAGFTMTATTSGGGAGDFALLPLLDTPIGTTEGYTFITANTAGPLGAGPVFGITPDALTIEVLQQPAFPGNPLHFVTGFPTLYPDAPLLVPAGTLSFLAGQSWRMVTVAFGPELSYLNRSNVVQLDW